MLMKERPILFSAPMVRAILAGKKTQTRRVVRLPADAKQVRYWAPPSGRSQPGWCDPGVNYWTPDSSGEGDSNHVDPCPYGQPGDRLRVKEAAWMWCERVPNGITKTGRKKWHYVPMREAPVHYAADRKTKPAINVVSPDTGNEWGWRLKIGRFLPGWASRIDLEVTGVRVERLNDISEADAVAEGIQQCEGGAMDYLANDYAQGYSPASSFRSLWQSINGADSWAANPWVWCVEFKRVKP